LKNYGQFGSIWVNFLVNLGLVWSILVYFLVKFLVIFGQFGSILGQTSDDNSKEEAEGKNSLPGFHNSFGD
jgi:hypothetical protein